MATPMSGIRVTDASVGAEGLGEHVSVEALVSRGGLTEGVFAVEALVEDIDVDVVAGFGASEQGQGLAHDEVCRGKGWAGDGEAGGAGGGAVDAEVDQDGLGSGDGPSPGSLGRCGGGPRSIRGPRPQ
jgi:hypothetical protein